MDTPERSQIGSSTAKFEDSPVFNFINSLSPIKPVKSSHTNHTFNSLSFTSLPSVFTSPHVTSDKDSRFLRRHQSPDPSKPDISCNDGHKIVKSDEVVKSDAAGENVAYADQLDEPYNSHASDLSQTLKYSSGSPECNRTPYCAIEVNSLLAPTNMTTSVVVYHQEVSETGLFEGEGNTPRICQTEQMKEGEECDWGGLISDPTDLIMFDLPDQTDAFESVIYESRDQNMSQFQEEHCANLYNTLCMGPMPSEQYQTEDHLTQPEESMVLKDSYQLPGDVASTFTVQCTTNRPSVDMDNTKVTNLHRGVPRRCLVFEMGAHRVNLNGSSNYNAPVLSQGDDEIPSSDKHLVPVKQGGNSPRCILPGIGLHLNALAVTAKPLTAVKHEALVTGNQSYTTTGSSVYQVSRITGEESIGNVAVPASFERDMQPPVNDVPVIEESSQVSTEMVCEDSNRGSPKKKRHKSEGDEACKRCNCKKSKCLKLYCECFAAGVYCIEPCSCRDCHNTPAHEDTVLATRKQIETRNPLAFAPKVIRSTDSIPDVGEETIQTPASARHKRGCNCKKSSCLKKYCECYQGGVGCSIDCRCEGCKNAFGRKDGSSLLDTETELDEEEIEKFEKVIVQRTHIPSSEEQNADTYTHATPLQVSRNPGKMPFSSKGKLQRSFTIGSSPGMQSFPSLSNPTFLRPQPEFGKTPQANVQDSDMPDLLRSKSTPIKNGSPNSKRVFPPHSSLVSASSSSASPGLRSSRKLILQSIPSFPSLTHQP